MHRLLRPRLIGGSRENAPTLRYRVDLALLVLRGPQRRAAVVEGAQVPLPVPCLALQRALEPLHLSTELGSVCLVPTLLTHRAEGVQNCIQEPPKPHALPSAFDADPVHAVVPVACTHQRQTMRPGSGAPLDRPQTMLIEGAHLFRDDRGAVHIFLVGSQKRSLQEGNLLIEYPGVTCGPHVVSGNVREPQQVV